MKQSALAHFLEHGHTFTLQGISIDNVIFGFHENQLKVLLLQSTNKTTWMLPGGFVNKEEHIDEAASRILKERTGLSAIYLQQFYAFGQPDRANNKLLLDFLQELNRNYDKDNWALQRFISLGYYALVEFAKVSPHHPGEITIASSWHDLDKLPNLLMDHKQIIDKALGELRLKINYQPIGYNLLPKEFPMKSLQSIYETILGRKLDRANFNRKMLSYEILDRKEKHFTGGAHKAPYLYSFNKKKYFKALETGLGRDF
jgi:8-oxo-dGTP diphosphatase